MSTDNVTPIAPPASGRKPRKPRTNQAPKAGFTAHEANECVLQAKYTVEILRRAIEGDDDTVATCYVLEGVQRLLEQATELLGGIEDSSGGT